MAIIRLNVNGRVHTVDVAPSTPLLYVLRNDLELRGPRFGCGLAQCGACTVLLRGAAVPSCVMPVSSAQGEPITTLEGLATSGKLDPVQQAWIDELVDTRRVHTVAPEVGAPLRAHALREPLLAVTGVDDDPPPRT